MNRINDFLVKWRITRAGRHIPQGSNVLDIGCFDGTLFKLLGHKIARGVGMDPLQKNTVIDGRFRIIQSEFPLELSNTEPFDVITLLAVLEHLEPDVIRGLPENCAKFLKPNGLLIITVPSAFVDPILHVMEFLHLIQAMSLEQHHGFDPKTTPAIFEGKGFELVCREKFQLGLNNIFVFKRLPARP